MLVSTKGRYALRVMIDLAEHCDGSLIPLQAVAVRQQISEKYLESIIVLLSRGGLVRACRGKGGGYGLTRPATDYTVGSILKLTEPSLAPTACLRDEKNRCARKDGCKTLPMWAQLDRIIGRYLETVTLQDLVDGSLPPDFS